ncbi:MAG: M15 family metallopeptidase [bacterium]|nr:M15 family metallopeptidase [bacterium]
MSKKQKQQLHNKIGIAFMSLIVLAVFAYLFLEPYTKASQINQLSDNQELTNTNHKNISLYAKKKLTQKLLKLITESQENYQTHFDFQTDASLQRYVSKTHPLHNIHYVPADLEDIQSPVIISKTHQAQLRAPANQAFQALAQAFYDQFHTKIIVRSSYRSYDSQQKLLDK